MFKQKAILGLLLLGMNVYGDGIVDNVFNKTTNGRYNYYYDGEILRNSLELFAKNNGLTIKFASDTMSYTLNKPVSGRFVVVNNEQLLNSLAKQYGFEWFIYSGGLYITSTQIISQSIKIATENMGMVKFNLQQLGLFNAKFGYAELPAANKITISGPQLYVNMIIDQINSLHIAPSSQQFAFYRLKYASATDTLLNFNNQQIIIPGVVTILQGMLQGSQTGSASALVSQVAEPVKNQANQILAKRDSSSNNDSNQSSPSSDATISYPLVQADSRTNSVLIRDKSSNLEIYKSLVELLDVPTPLIQVEVLIIHLDQQNLDQAGVNWWASTNKGVSGGYGAGNLSQTATPGNNLSFNYGQVNPGQLLVTNVASFTSSLQWLEQNNLAKTIGKPSLATTDNVPAIVNVNENLYLGNNPAASSSNSANNANSNSSTSTQITQALQITPHVIFKDNNQRDIKLSIVLQDGAINTQNNSPLPSTIQSSITSQAMIKDGQSILLAGYTRDIEQETISKVPFFGDIPLLGWFFKSKSASMHKTLTLYMVTPHIIWQSDTYKLKDYVMVDGNKFSIKDSYQLVTESATIKANIK